MHLPLHAIADFFNKRWPHLNAHRTFQSKVENRLCLVERNIMLPLKLVCLFFVCRHLFFMDLELDPESARVVALSSVKIFFLLYLPLTIGCSIMISGIRSLPLWYIELVVLTVAILDIILLSALTLITGGLESPLFWFYLLVRIAAHAMITHLFYFIFVYSRSCHPKRSTPIRRFRRYVHS